VQRNERACDARVGEPPEQAAAGRSRMRDQVSQQAEEQDVAGTVAQDRLAATRGMQLGGDQG
jgi:hypothetical protein